MKLVDLSIIIVSYNTRELTVACISSIVATIKNTSYEIIVVDNDSGDDTIEELNKLAIKQVKVIKNAKNLGFSKANNIGIKDARGKYVLFLNSDTVVYENTLDGMVEFMNKHREAGAATCFVELPNGKLDEAAHRGFPTPWRAFSHFSGFSRSFPHTKLFSGYLLGWMDKTKTHEIEACAGAFMMLKREAGEEVGWWDEDYFWYGEDLDFCYRLKEKGWKIYFVPDFRILHYKGVSGGIKKISKHISTATYETRKRAVDARFSAMRIFYGKHYKDKYPAFINWLVLFGVSAKHYFAKKLL